jgi:voltage-dependent calcium channel alpha-2/delta-4
VVLAEDRNVTGRFFGDMEGAVMDSLRDDSAVFRKIPMFDYQGLCADDEVRDSSNANFILTVSFVFTLYNFSAIVKFS